MLQFRKLLVVSLSSGVLAGMAVFVIQQFTVVPMILAAETYEAAHEHEHEVGGWQRGSLTAFTTVLTGIGFAAVLFGTAALAGRALHARQGALWGLAAFACFDLAPALGLPPKPPGVPLADLASRQLWWAGAVFATALGLWLLLGSKRAWIFRLAGVILLLFPHWLGAPAAAGNTEVPAQLIRQFTFASVATSGLFWLLLGSIGGLIYNRTGL